VKQLFGSKDAETYHTQWMLHRHTGKVGFF